MFANAKVLKTATPKAKKQTNEIELKGLEASAALDAMIKKLTTLKATIDGDLKSEAEAIFAKQGLEKKAKPENFKGVDGLATASVQLKKRSSASALSDEDVALLKEHKVSVQTDEQVVSTYVINPAYKDDQKLLEKVGKAIEKVAGVPADFILLQEGKAKTVTTDTSIDEVFATGNADTVALLLPLVATIALKPTIEDAEKVHEIVDGLLKSEA